MRNALAAGTARLSVGGAEVALSSPRLVAKKDVWPLLPPGTRTPITVSDDTKLLRMDLDLRP